MSSPADARARIAARLATIPGLRVYDTIPDGAFRGPFCMLCPPTGGDPETTDGGTSWTFPIRVVVSKWDGPRAQRALDQYLATDGLDSLRAAVEMAGGDVAVSGIRQYGKLEMGGVLYAAAEVAAIVLA